MKKHKRRFLYVSGVLGLTMLSLSGCGQQAVVQTPPPSAKLSHDHPNVDFNSATAKSYARQYEAISDRSDRVTTQQTRLLKQRHQRISHDRQAAIINAQLLWLIARTASFSTRVANTHIYPPHDYGNGKALVLAALANQRSADALLDFDATHAVAYSKTTVDYVKQHFNLVDTKTIQDLIQYVNYFTYQNHKRGVEDRFDWELVFNGDGSNQS